MNLAMLQPGQTGKITKIGSLGPMKRRLMDMGVLVGEVVRVEKIAPLGDPIEITVKAYKLSLRKKRGRRDLGGGDAMKTAAALSRALCPEKVITVAVAGNPNSGKSTLINAMAGTRLQVGNWAGVTVEKKEAVLEYQGRKIRLVDLPGTYSLSPYSQEEIIARDYLVHERPDVIVNVVDATNLERNLYLTVQLMELGIPVVAALNIYDEAEQKGYKIETNAIEKILGVRAIPTVATKKKGLEDLLAAVLEVGDDPGANRPRSLNYGEDIEAAAGSRGAADQRTFSLPGREVPCQMAGIQADGRRPLCAAGD